MVPPGTGWFKINTTLLYKLLARLAILQSISAIREGMLAHSGQFVSLGDNISYKVFALFSGCITGCA
jgi:hypothetical protein